MDYSGRLRALRAKLQEHELDALLVTHLPNIRYLCGFTGSAGILAIEHGRARFFTDGRYTQQARDEVHGVKVEITSSNMASATAWLSAKRSGRKIGIESNHITVSERNNLRRLLPKGCKLSDTPAPIEQLRLVKDAAEISRIRAACRLGIQLFSRLLKNIRGGAVESEIAAELEYEARRAGAEQMAFSSIVAGGKRSSFPHARASFHPLPARGFVVCDFGVILAGYCSDMTRTLHVGSPTRQMREGYIAVLEAQQAAISAVNPGTTVGEVDETARKLLKEKNLARFFTHSTGHGLGLEIHELPRVAAGQKQLLRPGMVITIEPGIYLPGKWGVRIEDTVVVTERGCEVLTECSKELITV